MTYQIKKNKTLKKKNNLIISNKFTQKQYDIICKNSANTYKTFEDKINDVFKKNKIDIVSTSYNLEKQVVSELQKAVNSKGIKPTDDFYSYINDKWITNFKVLEDQQYIIERDDFRLIQDKVYTELIQIIEEYISNSSEKDTKKKECIKTVYKSFNKLNTNDQIKCLSKALLEYIDELRKDKNNLWKKIGILNNNEITSFGSPFVWSINPDDKNPKIYKCYLEPPQLTLIDINVYFDDEKDTENEKKYKKNYRKMYFKYLDNLFTICFGKNHNFNVKDIFDTEIEILNAMGCKYFKNIDFENNYNLVTKDEALKKFGFNWNEFCKVLGFKKIPDDFVTSDLNYLKCGTKLLIEKWDSNQWKTFWIYLNIRQSARFNKEGIINFYEFEGKFQRGEEKIVGTYIKPIFCMGFCFNTFLTNQYISRYNNIQTINYVKTMAEDLKTVFIRIIQRNNWMQPKTKKKAILKLQNLKLTVGSPELLREDPLLDYKDDDPWGNLIQITLWRHNQSINLVGKPITDIPIIDWSQIPPKFIGTQAYIVNAVYTPTENGIYIPLGYIQKPFVDLDERGIEYNLSRIGFTIAHEMSHALDDYGCKYDEYGRLNNWWTEKDKKAFKKIQENVIKQYEKFASYDGINFDAEPSIGEDLADISGLNICQEYLRDFQLKNQDILPIQQLSYQAFFIFFAVQSRQQINKRAILAQLKTNPHPLDKYRCNIPLSRSEIFRAIYNVKKGGKMWWNSTNKVWN